MSPRTNEERTNVVGENPDVLNKLQKTPDEQRDAKRRDPQMRNPPMPSPTG